MPARVEAITKPRSLAMPPSQGPRGTQSKEGGKFAGLTPTAHCLCDVGCGGVSQEDAEVLQVAVRRGDLVRGSLLRRFGDVAIGPKRRRFGPNNRRRVVVSDRLRDLVRGLEQT